MSDRNMERLDNIDKNKYIYLLGDRVREFREDENYTQELLAEKSGLHVNTIKKIEAGMINPHIYTIYQIAMALDTSIGELTDI